MCEPPKTAADSWSDCLTPERTEKFQEIPGVSRDCSIRPGSKSLFQPWQPMAALGTVGSLGNGWHPWEPLAALETVGSLGTVAALEPWQPWNRGSLGTVAALEPWQPWETVYARGRPVTELVHRNRRRHSSSISLVRLAPQRLTPSSRTFSRVSRSRTPPAAFTCTCAAACLRIRARSSMVAPPLP